MLIRASSQTGPLRLCSTRPTALRPVAGQYATRYPHIQHRNLRSRLLISSALLDEGNSSRAPHSCSAGENGSTNTVRQASAATSTPGSASSQAVRILYASLSALALGCALFTGKAVASAVRVQQHLDLPVHRITGSSSSSSQVGRPGVAGTGQPMLIASVAHSVAAAAAVGLRSAPAARRPPVAQQQDITMKDVLRYNMRQLFALPAFGKIILVMAVAVPIIAVGSWFYLTTAKDPDCTWMEAMGKTYSVVINCPGSTVESERGWAADVVLHVVFLIGVFTYAVVLGIVTDDIRGQMDKARYGNYPVVEQQHTVLLNWNSQTLPVIKQMALARVESNGALFNGPVVVLADIDKEEMDEQVAEELDGVDLRVITRSGNPAKPSEQRRAAAAAAETVVLLWPTGLSPADASAQQAAVLSALTTAGGVKGQKVVVQSAGELVEDYDAVKMALELARSSTRNNQIASLTTAGWERMHQIMSQVAHQPGLEDVFADLLEYEDRTGEELGAEFYMDTCPAQLAGKPYQDVRRSYNEATVIGWVSPNGDPQLNPRDSEVVPPGSQLVFVAGVADAAVHSLDQPYEVAPVRLRGRRGSDRPPQNITMLCFDSSSAESALQSVVEFSSRGSHITLVCESPDQVVLAAVKRRGVRVSVVAGNPSSRTVLASSEVRLQQADAVMLCGLEAREETAGDMQAVASVLQLQSLASQHKKRKQPLPIVTTLGSAATEDVLRHTTSTFVAEQRAAAAAASEAAALKSQGKRRKGTAQDPAAAAAAAAAAVVPPVSLHLLKPDELMSGMLTQTAGAPQLAKVFSELFAEETGHEVYLRDPKKNYGLAYDKPICWSEVMEVVRKRNETTIGFIWRGVDAERSANSSGLRGHGACGSEKLESLLGNQAEVHLAVRADAEVVLRPGDKLVVLALE